MRNALAVKVCGMKDAENIGAVRALGIDYMGFIFYKKSPRYAGDSIPPTIGVKRTGVFVDETVENVEAAIQQCDLNAVQLHGAETPEYCSRLKETGVEVIKAFSVNEYVDFQQMELYEATTDIFLFDTKTALPGGSGKSFDWAVLKKYKGQKPFFLSGGIGPEDVEKVKAFKHPALYGLDLNSRFENRPGEKEVSLLKNFLAKI